MSKQVAIATLIAGINAQTERTIGNNVDDSIECTHKGAPFVSAAEDYLDDLKQQRDDLDNEFYKKTLTDAAADAKAVYDTALENWQTQEDLITPFNTALETAKTNYSAQTKIVTDATNAMTALSGVITTATNAKTSSKQAWDTQNNLISSQKTDNEKYTLAVADHTTEKATLSAAKTTADDALTAAEKAITDATNEATALITERDNELAQGTTGVNDYKYGLGQAKLAADAATTLAGKTTTTEQSNVDADTAYAPAKKAFEKQAALALVIHNFVDAAAAQSSACKFEESPTTYDCSQYAGDATKAIYDAAQTTVTTNTGQLWIALNGAAGNNGPKTAWDTLITALGTAMDAQKKATFEKEVADANLTAIDGLIKAKQATYLDVCLLCAGATPACTCASVTNSGNADPADNTKKLGEITVKGNLLTIKETKQVEATNAKTALELVYKEVSSGTPAVITKSGQLVDAETDLATGNRLLSLLQADLEPLTNDLAVKEYLLKIETDKNTAEVDRKAVANEEVTNLLLIQTMAQATVDRAKTTWDFYNAIKGAALTAKSQADEAVSGNETAITNFDNLIEAAQKAVDAAIGTCKGLGYDAAQATLKKVIEAEKAQQDAYNDLKVAYADKSAHPDTGAANTICAFPLKESKDADQLPRPVCVEGLCCGAAQKFLKDGTKLAIETCQEAEGTHTYEYYPPFLETMSVEPTPETWRFQCISGAQKLIATASAALAASYMMA